MRHLVLCLLVVLFTLLLIVKVKQAICLLALKSTWTRYSLLVAFVKWRQRKYLFNTVLLAHNISVPGRECACSKLCMLCADRYQDGLCGLEEAAGPRGPDRLP